MKSNRKNNILCEIVKAEELLDTAEDLYNQELYTESVSASYCSAFHASIAAHLTAGNRRSSRNPDFSLIKVLKKYRKNLDPYVERQMKAARSSGSKAGLDYDDKETQLRLYQSRELVLEVKDFLRKTLRF